MKPVIIIIIIGVIVIGAMIMMRPIPVEKVTIDFDQVIIIESIPPLFPDVEPWSGLNCDEMLDFSGSDEHDLMNESMHLEFHDHYMDNCSDIEFEEPSNIT